MLCLEKEEFENMYKEARYNDLFMFLESKGYSVDDLKKDPKKMEEVASSVSVELLKGKDEVEIFAALFEYSDVYGSDSMVCFVLKDTIDPRKTPIATLEELKASIREDSLTDFSIMSDDGLRQFQLKQYKGKATTVDLFTFINEKVAHYGKDLGNVNLLIVIQSADSDIGNIDFKELHERIKSIGLKSESDILISYNEENKFDVINSVYPTLGTNRKKRPKVFKWHKERAG